MGNVVPFKKPTWVLSEERKKSGLMSYVVRISINGKRVRKVFATESQRKEYIEIVTGDRVPKIVIDGRNGVVVVPFGRLVREQIEYELATNKITGSTQLSYMKFLRNHMDPIFKTKPLSLISEKEAHEFMVKTKSKTPSWTVAAYALFLKAEKIASRLYDCPDNRLSFKVEDLRSYIPKKEEGSVVKFIDPSVIVKIFELMKGQKLNRKMAWPMFKLLLATGMRRGELVALTWDCVDFSKGTISVSKSVNSIMQDNGKSGKELGPTKGKNMRTIQMNDMAREALLELKEVANGIRWLDASKNNYVLVSTRYCAKTMNSPMDGSSVYNNVKAVTDFALDHIDIGIRVSPHKLRHSFATTCLKMAEGNNFAAALVALQNALGHKSIDTTMIYARSVGEDAKRLTGGMDRLFQKPEDVA